MMELERGRGHAVAAPLAAAATRLDQLGLDAAATLLLVPISLRIAPSSTMLLQFRRQGNARRMLRRVVRSERRTSEAEATPVEVPELPGDDLTQCERLPTGITGLCADRALDRPPRLSLRAMRQTLEASLSAQEVQPNATDDDRGRELAPAFTTDLHDRTVVLTGPPVKQGRAGINVSRIQPRLYFGTSAPDQVVGDTRP